MRVCLCLCVCDFYSLRSRYVFGKVNVDSSPRKWLLSVANSSFQELFCPITLPLSPQGYLHVINSNPATCVFMDVVCSVYVCDHLSFV